MAASSSLAVTALSTSLDSKAVSACVYPTGSQIASISGLDRITLLKIFSFLAEGDAKKAACVCWEWKVLNTYPYGSIPISKLSWGMRLQDRLSQERFERTSYECLDRRIKAPLLQTFNPDGYFSANPPVSVSEAFLRTDAVERTIAHGKDLLAKELRDDPLLHNILNQVFSAEKEHALAYQPFYHSANKSVFFFGFATKMLLEVMNQNAASSKAFSSFSPIHWFRFPQLEDSVFPETVEGFLAKYPMIKAQKDGGEHDDHHKDIKQWLLAVSPFLFSNFDAAGESTWELFLTNRSIYPPDDASYFNALCDHFHLLPDPSKREFYAKAFTSLIDRGSAESERFLKKSRSPEQRENFEFTERGNRDLGVLFQIFVPKPLVDRIAYPCLEYGIPKQYRDQKMSQVFKDICADPTKSSHNPVQARMLTSSLITRGNEIKVLTYGHNNYFESPEGKELCREFKRFFLSVVLDSQT